MFNLNDVQVFTKGLCAWQIWNCNISKNLKTIRAAVFQ